MGSSTEDRTVYIIGHRNPDTDSICSAISYAQLKNSLGQDNVIPARCGNTNAETDFVLDYFSITPPKLINDVYLRVEHIITKNVTTLRPEQPILEAGKRFHETNIKFFPVVSENLSLLGVISATDISKRYIHEMAASFPKINTTLDNIVSALEGRLLVGAENTREVEGSIVVCAMATGTLGDYINRDSIAILGNRPEAQREVIEKNAAVLIVTGNLPIREEILSRAGDRGCIVISTPFDTYTTARLVTASVPIKNVMTRDVHFFYIDDPIREIKHDIVLSSHRAYPVIGEGGKFEGIVSYYDFLDVTPQQVILVDHNEKSQAVEGIEEAEIIEIIDHHRIGDVQTLSPIFMRNEPVGSTGTIVSKIYREHGLSIDPKIAGLLLSAILSDTALLKSPTTTGEDHRAVDILSKISGLDPEKWGMELIKNRGDWEKAAVGEILQKDFKEYLISSKSIGVAQLEVLDSGGFDLRRDEIIENILAREEASGFDLFIFMVTDIIKQGTMLFFNPEHFKTIENAFGKKTKGPQVFLENVMSRKKQVIPPLTRYLSQL
ncbi:MAG: putative manganese-dependent inorganic diphosphatase [Clostridia bacterium]|nr:putative manganese-dependent inorganic diphosphatase [Clostridia bacterium]